jgi:thiol-disulfide isomerase/thioredoxin
MQFFKKLALCIILAGAFLGLKPALASNIDVLAKGGSGGWLNVTRPLTADDMKGRLVLLDFWTYGCINCIQIIPDLKALENKFGDDLLIIGVHSAKFKGEQGNSRILSAAKRFGLEHPVINDSDFAIWNSFKVKAWPTLILLNEKGVEISRYQGEGHRLDLEKDIQKNIGNVVQGKGRDSVSSLILKEQSKSNLSFPARIKKYGDLFYIADSGNNRIIAINQTGKIIKKFFCLSFHESFQKINL